MGGCTICHGEFLSLSCRSALFYRLERDSPPLSHEICGLGRKLNRAGTNPAASALSAQLKSDISTLTQSVSNVESGANFVRTAEGGLAGVADLVNRGRELTIQSSNGTLNDSQSETLN